MDKGLRTGAEICQPIVSVLWCVASAGNVQQVVSLLTVSLCQPWNKLALSWIAHGSACGLDCGVWYTELTSGRTYAHGACWQSKSGMEMD